MILRPLGYCLALQIRLPHVIQSPDLPSMSTLPLGYNLGVHSRTHVGRPNTAILHVFALLVIRLLGRCKVLTSESGLTNQIGMFPICSFNPFARSLYLPRVF